ncbi:DEAD/DEAH box helicase [Oleiharenicola lentus]|uniref:DEAD/DEAH box helicase n=1 Tax=Oleiharenicola lentus TaxID=2508720 RepID=UPI003F66B0C6
MITRVEPPAANDAALFGELHPQLAAWFRGRFKAFSPAQRATLPEILAERSTLLSSPTGSGKTLAAFLGVFDYLAKAHDRGELPKGIVAVYVSPLRALAYDLQKNLNAPLAELGWDFIRVGLRSGDTSMKERAAQKRKPPHILVTTPESLTLLLSQLSWVQAFKPARFLIIDELHALAENKRGAMLMVSAERLEEVIQPAPLTRIGLSATVAPLDTVAEFLVGPTRACRIAEVTQRKAAHVEVFSPLRKNPYPPAGYTATRVLRELGEVLRTKRTTLIFTNTRSGAETIGLRLKEILPDLAPQIEVHHASLDRALRIEVEDKLKRGELRAVVCSTSLEMGIDIGSIDLVVMVSAPKGVSRALQRIGRSGHSMGETSRGLMVASNINDLVECAVTARMMDQRALEPVKIHDDPLDVLAQHLVGLAIFESVTPDEAFALVRRSYPFRALPREKFDRVLRYLEGGGKSLERNYRDTFGKVILRDGVLCVPRPKVAREFYQNVGTISTDQMIQVKLKRRNLGQVEESFMKRLRIGDVFVLNGRCVRLVSTELLTAKVVEAKSTLPTVPRWNANKMPLASGLAEETVRLRTELAARLADEAVAMAWLQSEYGLSKGNAEAITRHFQLQARESAIPTKDFFLIERVVEGELRHYFFHSLIGRSANDALSRVVAQRLQQTKGGNALVTIDDYGFMFTLQAFQEMAQEEWRALFSPEGMDEALRQALTEASLVKWQFRVAAQTGLMVPRRVHGAERGKRSLQWSSEIIFNVLRQYEPDHPLLEEAYAEATLRFLDLPRAREFLEKVSTMPWRLLTQEQVSPFSFGMYVTKIKETMTLEDPETTIERLYHAMYGAAAEMGASSLEKSVAVRVAKAQI